MIRYAGWPALLLGLLGVAQAAAPGDFAVRVWNTRNGLPQDAVKAITQTPDGYLWVGTFGGLARFDGNRFETFQVRNLPELPDNLINALMCDRQGRLWIGHDSGFVTLLEKGKGRRISLPAEWQRSPIRNFGEDADGCIWVLNASQKLAVISPAGELLGQPELKGPEVPLHFQSAPDGSLRLVSFHGWCYVARTNALIPDPDQPPVPSDGKRVVYSRLGGYWALREGRLGRWHCGKPAEKVGPVKWGDSIFAITCEWNQLLAAGTFHEGLCLTARDGSSAALDAATGLPSNWIAVLFVDQDGILWVGTGDRGLAEVAPRRVTAVQPPGEAGRQRIQSVTPRNGNGIWVSTEGAGLFEFDGRSWRRAPDMPNVNVQVYSSVAVDPAGHLWAESVSEGLCRLEGQTWRQIAGVPRVAGARGALLMQSNAVWAAGFPHLLRFSGPAFASMDRLPGGGGVCCLAEDGAGGIWYGGYETGLGHWHKSQTTVLRTRDGLPGENLLALLRSSDGTLWIGTDGAGLVRMKDGKYGVVSRRNGLPSDSICQLIEDDQGRLWMGTYGGICAVTVQELQACAEGRQEQVTCSVLDTADGMESLECSSGNQPAACRTADGRLWFATPRGVAVVAPAQITLNRKPPQVWVEQVRTDAGLLLPENAAEPLCLPKGQRRLQFEFNAPCLRAAHRVRFKHRLEPVESEWVDSETTRQATYAQVPPGEYRFRVIACNEDGVWSEKGATVGVVVPPFLWERKWFAPLCWLTGLGTAGVSAFAFIRQRLHRRVELLEHQRAVERERSRIAKDLHDDLGGSLTEIHMLATAITRPRASGSAPAEVVAEIGAKSTRLVRTLDEIVWAVNPRHDSVSALAEYLSGASREFLSAAGLRLRLDIPHELPAIPISPEQRHHLFMAAKEALTNVVRHAQAAEVRVQLKVEAGRLAVVVEDNGCGFEPGRLPTSGADGLSNMRERLVALGGECRIRSQPGAGTTVELELPIQ